jgi:hypothetical protein
MFLPIDPIFVNHYLSQFASNQSYYFNICDISKAFDRVWHEGLIKKLKSYGILGDLLIWFKNYLRGRRQFVFVNNELSDSGLVKAGVPQGSVSDPLLFLLYINDIKQVQLIRH